MILIPKLVIKLGKNWLVDSTCLNSKVKIKTITTIERLKKELLRTTNQLKKKLLSFNTYEI